MTKRHYEVSVTCTLLVEIDERVLKRGTSKSFAKSFYKFDSKEEVAAHIGRNHVLNQTRLSNLDGFADLPNSLVVVHELDDDAEARENPPVRVPAERRTR